MFLSRSALVLLRIRGGEDEKYDLSESSHFSSQIVPKNHLSPSFFDVSFFSVLICALVAGGAFIPATVTYIILFFPNITFQSFSLFFVLDHEISHISRWKRKIKAHYAESCFQVCDISPIFDVVFTIASQKAAFLIWNILRTSRRSVGLFFFFYSIEFILTLISPLPADVRLINNIFFSIRVTVLGSVWTQLLFVLPCVCWSRKWVGISFNDGERLL